MIYLVIVKVVPFLLIFSPVLSLKAFQRCMSTCQQKILYYHLFVLPSCEDLWYCTRIRIHVPREGRCLIWFGLCDFCETLLFAL